MLLHALAPLGHQGLGIQQADDAVGVAHRGNLGVGHHDGLIRMAHGQRRAALDSGGAVADDPVEHLAQFADHPGHALFREGVLVAGLGRCEEIERLHPLVANERLGELGFSIGDIDEIVNDPALRPQDQVEIAQADVKVDHTHILSRLRKRSAYGGG